jgi:drug/metabolite transporter (DMT)-like permease
MSGTIRSGQVENTASILILISGLAHAVVNAILKAGDDKMSRRALIDGFSALILAPAVFLVPLPANAWSWLIASAVVHGLYLFALIKSFEQSDMTVAYPIARGIAPMLAAAGAVAIFHEPISVAVVLGILAIACGVMMIGVSHKMQRSALLWAVLTGFCIASYTVIDAQGVRAAPTALSYIVWTFLLLGGALGSFFAIWRGRAFFVTAAGQWKPGLIAGALSIITYGFALLAFRLGATPRLAALRETSILFGTAIAVIFLKERLTTLRLSGVLAIALGAVALIAVR